MLQCVSELSQENMSFNYKSPFQLPAMANIAKCCLPHLSLKGELCNTHFKDTITKLVMF